MIRGRRLVLLAWVLSAGAAAAQETVSREPVAGDLALDFRHAAWTAEAWSRRAGGELGWLVGPDGSLRLELGLEGTPGPGPLLRQEGEGWTLIVAGGGDATLNAWGREWRRLESGLGPLALAAAAFLAAGDEGPASARVVVPDLAPGRDEASRRQPFRRDMVRRGRGRGGEGEIVVLTRAGTVPGDPWEYAIRSTRRPGRIRVAAPDTLALVCAVPEVFLPLWPIAEVASEIGNKPGTSSPADR